MAGWETLGQVLGGGIDRQGAYQEGRYRSAQTEGALAAARKAQTEAQKQELETDLMQRIAEASSEQLLADDLMGAVVAAGRGTDFASYGQGRLRNQELEFRRTAADPTATALSRTRALQAVEGKPSSDLQAIGAGGVTNLTDELPGVDSTPLGQSMIDENVARAALLEAERKRPQDFRSPGSMYRITSVGGVPAQVRLGENPAAALLATPETVAANTSAVQRAKTEGAGMGKRTLDLPTAKLRLASTTSKLDRMIDLASKLEADEALWSAVGIGRPIASIPGTEGAKLRAMINSLVAQVGFGALQDMRDNSKTGGALGPVSNIENRFLQQSIAALDTALNPEDFREQLGVLVNYAARSRERVLQAFHDTYPELAGGEPPSAAPETQVDTPPVNAKGWQLMIDANGNKAYVSPDGSQYEEVQ